MMKKRQVKENDDGMSDVRLWGICGRFFETRNCFPTVVH